MPYKKGRPFGRPFFDEKGVHMPDWKPNVYLKFEKERTQPSIDLAARVEPGLMRRIIDIGCGPGNSTAVLRRRWPEVGVTGLDNSEAMLEHARQRDPGVRWVCADIAGKLPDLGVFDLVFSNAALQWVPGLQQVIPTLFGMVAKGGTLAVQVPYARETPLITEKEALANQPRWRERFATVERYSSYPMEYYYDIISDLGGEVALWETRYCHIMDSYADMVSWYTGSGLRPYLDRLPEAGERRAFLHEYEALLAKAYPKQKDGAILFPFPRIFFTVRKL